MSTPITPLGIFVYKIKREYEKTGKTIFPESELLSYAEEVVVKASEIDDEEYWILYQTKQHGLELKTKLSKICDYSYSKRAFMLNQEKLENGGNLWAEKIIGAMKYSFLKGSILTLEEKDENNKESKVALCD